MACNYHLSALCRSCSNYIKTTAVTLSNNVLQIELPAVSLTNCSNFCVDIIQPIPSGITSNTKVQIIANGTAHNVVTPCCANFLYADQIVANRIYCFKYGIDSATFIYRGGWRLKKTASTFPIVSATKTTTSNKVSSDK